MNKHTETPWFVFEAYDCDLLIRSKKWKCNGVDYYDECIAVVPADDGNYKENAEHIVKCVNLVAELEQKGITIEQLEKLAEWQPIETALKENE